MAAIKLSRAGLNLPDQTVGAFLFAGPTGVGKTELCKALASFLFDTEEAMQDGAPQLHANTPNNVICHYRIRKGDMEDGWAKADVIVEGSYSTGYQEHAFLQPEAGVAYIDEEDRVTVVVSGVSRVVHPNRRR